GDNWRVHWGIFFCSNDGRAIAGGMGWCRSNLLADRAARVGRYLYPAEDGAQRQPHAHLCTRGCGCTGFVGLHPQTSTTTAFEYRDFCPAFRVDVELCGAALDVAGSIANSARLPRFGVFSIAGVCLCFDAAVCDHCGKTPPD